MMAEQTLDTAEDVRTGAAPPAAQSEEIRVQSCGFLLELSLDWLVLRASENVDDFLGVSHVTMIDEPLGRFLMAQPLHDLRNLFSRLSGTTGVARAYGIRLTDEARLFDVAFQLSDGRVLFEGLATSQRGMGEALGTVGGLIYGLGGARGQALLDGGARRMRALSGFDCVTVVCGAGRAESSRGSFPESADGDAELPSIVADATEAAIPVFPRRPNDAALRPALLRAPAARDRERLRADGVASSLRVPCGESGVFVCRNRSARPASLELHAAAELFAQFFAMRLEIDRLLSR
jgi:light-regulated signal transduction histidine kinase (bacteriophytochrome)